jgi:hypothetical protein
MAIVFLLSSPHTGVGEKDKRAVRIIAEKTNFENRRCGRAKFAKQILGISDFQNLVFGA